MEHPVDFEQKLKHNNSIFFTGKTFRYLKFQKKLIVGTFSWAKILMLRLIRSFSTKALRENFPRSDKDSCKCSWNLERLWGNRQVALRRLGINNHDTARGPTQLSLHWLVKALSLNQDKSART